MIWLMSSSCSNTVNVWNKATMQTKSSDTFTYLILICIPRHMQSMSETREQCKLNHQIQVILISIPWHSQAEYVYNIFNLSVNYFLPVLTVTRITTCKQHLSLPVKSCSSWAHWWLSSQTTICSHCRKSGLSPKQTLIQNAG